jgi:hypothetical protein
LARHTLPARAYAACIRTLPVSVGIPAGWQVVRLPAHGSTVALPALKSRGLFRLIVEPPPGRSATAVAYVWQINVTFTVDSAPDMVSSSPRPQVNVTSTVDSAPETSASSPFVVIARPG